MSNMYTRTVTPGPGTYSPEQYTSLANRLKKNRSGASKAKRNCLLPVATHTFPYRSIVSPRPGPGNYNADYNAVLPERSTTFDGHAKQAHSCESAQAVALLLERRRTLE